MSGGVGESVLFSSIGAGSTAAFKLKGGKYAVNSMATWGGGNSQLQTLAADASTWLNVGSSVTANGVATFDLPPGQYRFTVTTATAAYIVISSIPY